MMDKIKDYCKLVLEVNKNINLTSYKTEEEFFNKLVKPSIAVLPELSLDKNTETIDIGSGSGIPGIPIAINHPETPVTLVESSQKKAAFLRFFKNALELDNLDVIDARAETLGQLPAYREQFQYATARALGTLSATLEMLGPLVRIGGNLVLFRGEREKFPVDDQKIKEELGLVIEKIEERYYRGKVWFISKIKPSNPKYPRRIGVPGKKDTFIRR